MNQAMKDEILTVIAKHYPFGLDEIKAFYDNQTPLSFDWVVDVCEHAVEYGFATLEAADRDIAQAVGEVGDIERKAMEQAFKVIDQRKGSYGFSADDYNDELDDWKKTLN